MRLSVAGGLGMRLSAAGGLGMRLSVAGGLGMRLSAASVSYIADWFKNLPNQICGILVILIELVV